MAEYELVWAIVASIILAGVIVYSIKKIKKLEKRFIQKQTNAYNAGISFVRGEITQILAGYSILNDYKQLAILGTVSKNMSLDLLGISDEYVDLIEVKTKGAGFSESEKKVKQLIDEGKVRYRVIDGEFPNFKINYRDRV